MKADVTLTCPVTRSPRVLQISGMFDLPADAKAAVTVTADLPLEDKPWNVGLITGPSGAGKSTLARHLWPDAVMGAQDWPADAALVDGFPAAMGIREVTGLLSAVGLASPPAWVRPFATLSNGERFRAEMARALADADGLVVVDEFSSVVDRQVAKVASHAVQKAVRRAGRQLVAVTCHYDVEEWLQPDWLFDVASGEFLWRLVQPHPPVELDICPVSGRDLWPLFARHHYMSADLHSGARCFAAYVDSRPVAFTSYLHFPHVTAKNIKKAHRIVVLPDWQGLGIAGQLSEWMGGHLTEQGFRYRITTAHPAFIHQMARSPRWRLQPQKRRLDGFGRSNRSDGRSWGTDPRSLSARSFEYVPVRPATPAPGPSLVAAVPTG